MGRFFCAAAAEERAEPLFATASPVVRWLLVEQPGPWGPESLPSSRLGPERTAALRQAARAAPARPLLVRRPGGAHGERRHVLAVESRPGHERVLVRTLDWDDELDFTWDGPGWAEQPGSIFLICTHGKHDACCAVRGRPIAAAAGAEHPERTWECSHIGGDRFAANAVVLPQGVYLGRLRADTALDVLTRTAAGELPDGHARGRSALSAPAQAAQHFASRQVDGRALPAVGQQQVGDQRWRVVLRDDDSGDLAVTVRRAATDPACLTCRADTDHSYPLFELVGLDRVNR